MNRIKTVIVTGFLIVVLFSCGQQQSEQADDSAGAQTETTAAAAPQPETSSGGTDSAETGEIAEELPGPASAIMTEEVEAQQPEVSAAEPAQIPVSPEPEPAAEAASPAPLPSPIIEEEQTTPTRIDIIREMIKAALSSPRGTKTAEPEETAEDTETTDFSSLVLPEIATESGQRTVILTTPDFVSYYKSEVKIAGFFSGFPDFEEAVWEISGTDRGGDIPVKPDGSFNLALDTSGLSNTLVLRVKATDSAGVSAEELRVLVNDGIGPEISIFSPLNDTVYGMDTIIEGRISGDLTEASIETTEGLSQVQLEPDSDGLFRVRITDLIAEDQTGEIPENTIVRIRAVDSNNNESTAFLSLFREQNAGIIRLSEPADGSLFTSELTLRGEATGISEILWDIPGTAFSGAFKTENGNFNYPLKLSGIDDSFLIRLKGSAGNGTETATVRLYNSRITPEIAISAPSDGGYYTDSIPLTGKVGAEDADVYETVKNLKWGIPGTENVDNLIFFDETGNFTMDLSLSKYSGVLPLEISVEDYNNNTGRRILRLEDGKLPPEIKISLPSNDSEYGAFLDIAGIVADPYEGTDNSGISELSYQLASLVDFDIEPLSGFIQLSPDNRFGIQLQTSEIHGEQQLTLSALASNGNRAEHTVKLEESENDITSFNLSASDGDITADWRPISVKARYSLQVTDDGSSPSAEDSVIYSDITPPFSITDIENGRLYSVRLVADTELGLLSSAVKSVIPSAGNTFRLKAEGEFRQIKLDWKLLPGSGNYNIYRTNDLNKAFSLVGSGIGGSSYTDKNISYGRDYYYYITPAGHDYAKSGFVKAAMMKAPDQRVIELNKLTSFNPVNVTVFGNYVYTAAGEDGFRIIDKTNPDSLSVTGSLTGINVEAVKVRGDYAYLACGDSGLCILNISAPQLPFLTGRKATTDAVDICLKDNYAYIADGEAGIKIMDITDARTPERLDFIRDINSTAVLTYGDILFSNDSNSVHLFDISNPVAPVTIAEYNYRNVESIWVEDSHAYLLSRDSGLVILDISELDSPVQLSATGLTDPRDLAVSEGFAYIADGRAGLRIINVNNPKRPETFDSLNTGTAIAVDVSGENVIIAEESGLSAIQTFLQGVSFVINKLKLGLKNAGIALLENILIIPTADKGIEFYNTDEPANPLKLADIPLPVTSDFPVVGRERLYLSEEGNYLSAYSLDGGNRVESWEPVYRLEFPDIIDFIRAGITTDDREIITVATLGGDVHFTENGSVISSIQAIEARDCVINGNTAYISDNRAGLMIYDISDLTAPVLVSTIELEGSDHMVYGGENLFIITRKGIAIFNTAEKQKPLNAGLIKTNYAENAEISGDLLYVAEGYKGLSVYDISDPENPVLLTLCDTVYAADLVVSGEFAFVTDGTGLNTIQIFIPDWIR